MYSVLDDVELTIGAFENTRIFSIDKFLISEEERRGPKARIYLAGLLNWVQFEDALTIRAKAPRVWDSIYVPTDHSEFALGLVVDPTFNQPPLYKHYFTVMNDEFAVLNGMNRKARVTHLTSRVAQARHWYKEIAGANIQLERHGRGAHLPAWAEYLASLKG